MSNLIRIEYARRGAFILSFRDKAGEYSTYRDWGTEFHFVRGYFDADITEKFPMFYLSYCFTGKRSDYIDTGIKTFVMPHSIKIPKDLYYKFIPMSFRLGTTQVLLSKLSDKNNNLFRYYGYHD